MSNHVHVIDLGTEALRAADLAVRVAEAAMSDTPQDRRHAVERAELRIEGILSLLTAAAGETPAAERIRLAHVRLGDCALHLIGPEQAVTEARAALEGDQ